MGLHDDDAAPGPPTHTTANGPTAFILVCTSFISIFTCLTNDAKEPSNHDSSP
jgi:hypothetical protein